MVAGGALFGGVPRSPSPGGLGASAAANADAKQHLSREVERLKRSVAQARAALRTDVVSPQPAQ
jgi:hypothetical protein